MIVIQYILVSAIIFWLVVFVYIKIRFPFWNIQPVFHTYDYWRYFYKIPFLVYKYRPVKTKYYDPTQIQTLPYLECSPEQINEMVDLLQCYYMTTDRIIYNVSKDDLHPYLTGHKEPAFVSFNYEKLYNKITVEDQTNITDASALTVVVCSPKPVGFISSRPVNMYFRPTLKEELYTEKPVYFMDFLCVHRERDVKKLSRSLLQTHEYNQSIANPTIQISLIKKEIDLFEGVVPFVEYMSTTYYLRNIHFPELPPHFHVVKVNKDNIDILIDFLYIQTHMNFKTNPCLLDVCLFSNIGSIIALIEQQLLYVFCLRRGEHVYGFYFFKDPKTQYDDLEGNTLQCIASVMNCSEPNVFYLGLLHSIKQILKQNKTYKILIIEEISHNTILVNKWKEKHTPIFSNKTAYYLYNLIYPCSPLYPERCLIIL